MCSRKKGAYVVLGPRYRHRDCRIRNSGSCSLGSGPGSGLLLFGGGLWPLGRCGLVPAVALEPASKDWPVRSPADAPPAGLWPLGCRELVPAFALESASEDCPPWPPAVHRLLSVVVLSAGITEVTTTRRTRNGTPFRWPAIVGNGTPPSIIVHPGDVQSPRVSVPQTVNLPLGVKGWHRLL